MLDNHCMVSSAIFNGYLATAFLNTYSKHLLEQIVIIASYNIVAIDTSYNVVDIA